MAKAAAILWDDRLVSDTDWNRMRFDFSGGVEARITVVEAACCAR
jgi:hypothetical protein